MRLASVAAHFGRDIDRSLEKMAGIVADARSAGVDLLVFPDATLGGYLSDLRHPDATRCRRPSRRTRSRSAGSLRWPVT